MHGWTNDSLAFERAATAAIRKSSSDCKRQVSRSPMKRSAHLPAPIPLDGRILPDLVRRLKADGLDGVEVHYSTHTPRQTREYLALAKQLDLLVTGGSDFHGLTKPDIDVGIGKGTLHVPGSLLDKLRNTAAQR
jgi:predicted metal-dependent phosphoesterase TrpH